MTASTGRATIHSKTIVINDGTLAQAQAYSLGLGSTPCIPIDFYLYDDTTGLTKIYKIITTSAGTGVKATYTAEIYSST
jgi:hypothetical protein